MKLDNPLEETKAGAILGTDSFVVWIKEQFLDIKSLKNQDHSGLKELKKDKKLSCRVSRIYQEIIS